METAKTKNQIHQITLGCSMKQYILEECGSCGRKTYYRYIVNGKGFCKLCYDKGQSSRGSKKIK